MSLYRIPYPVLAKPLQIEMRLPFQKRLSIVTSNPLLIQPDIEKDANISSENAIHFPPRLLKFQNLVGICSPDVMRANSRVARPAPNQGVYKRTVDAEAKIKLQYTISNFMVNTFYMLQIIVGAALTALGAAKGPASAVTFLGAVNTVIAGLLTYMKGQGLPMRLEQNLHLLRTLREHIETREREFFQPDCALDVDEEVDRVTRMYQEVRQTEQDNAPGTVLPPRGSITSLLKKPDINRSDVPAPRGDKSAGEMLKTGLQDLASLRHHVGDSALEEKESRFKGVKEGVKSLEHEMERLGGIAKDTMRRISEDHEHEKSVQEKVQNPSQGHS